MSARKNWSALSSLARQWTVEDEEEVERERRRRVRGSSSTADPDDDLSPDRAAHPAPRDATPTTANNDSGAHRRGTEHAGGERATGQGVSSEEQTQLDFIEVLRKRDEKRRLRRMESLRSQKEEEEEEEEEVVVENGGGGARVESLGHIDKELYKEEGKRVPPPHVAPKPTHHAPPPAAPRPTSSISSTASPTNSITSSITSSTTSTIVNRQQVKRDSLGKDPDPKPPSTRSRNFVSSVSISLDKSASPSERSGRSTPMSPCSPTASLSPTREHWASPCQSPSPRGAQSPVHNGHTHETNATGSPSNGSVNTAQTTRPAFTKQSARTASFRMLQKKEEEKTPLQRSMSVRLASKKFESNTEQSPDDDKTSPFQRNSKQRMSSKSIQEMMERLALASQKSDVTSIRSPDVAQRTLFLMDEVSRKRGLFEKDQQAGGAAKPGISRQELRGFASGMSDRINLWLNKTNQSGTSPNPTDLRNVDITTKRSLFEVRGEEDDLSNNTTGKI